MINRNKPQYRSVNTIKNIQKKPESDQENKPTRDLISRLGVTDTRATNYEKGIYKRTD